MEDLGKWMKDFFILREKFINEKRGGEVFKGVMQAHEAAFKEGALGFKEKHLMAMCVAIQGLYKPCIIGHCNLALEAGATKDEILEAVGVTLSVCGTTSMGGAGMLFKLLEEKGLI